MTVKLVTPAEAKAMWHSVEKPSTGKVAARFTAAGRPVSRATIGRWQRAGWGRSSVASVATAVAAAVTTMDLAAPALTGDVRSTLADIVAARAAEAKAAEAGAEEKAAPPDHRSSSERVEQAMLTAIDCATIVWQTIRDVAAAVPGGTAVASDAPLMLLLGAPDGIAKLMMAASAAINMGAEGIRQICALRADEAAAVPGAQTVYPPGHGPHAERSHADGLHGKRSYLSRSTIEAIDQALDECREQDGAVAAPGGAADAA